MPESSRGLTEPLLSGEDASEERFPILGGHLLPPLLREPPSAPDPSRSTRQASAPTPRSLNIRGPCNFEGLSPRTPGAGTTSVENNGASSSTASPRFPPSAENPVAEEAPRPASPARTLTSSTSCGGAGGTRLLPLDEQAPLEASSQMDGSQDGSTRSMAVGLAPIQVSSPSSVAPSQQAPASPSRGTTWAVGDPHGGGPPQPGGRRRRLSKLMSILAKKDGDKDGEVQSSRRAYCLSPAVSFHGDIPQVSPSAELLARSLRGSWRGRADSDDGDASVTTQANQKALTNSNALRSLEILRQRQTKGFNKGRALPPRRSTHNDFTNERVTLARRHEECIQQIHKIFELSVGDSDPDLPMKVVDFYGSNICNEEMDCLIYYKTRFCNGQLIHFAVWLQSQEPDDSPDWVRLVLDAGADPRAWASYTTPAGINYIEPIHIAAGLGSVRALSTLVAAVEATQSLELLNAYTQLCGTNFYAPIHEAAFAQQKSALKWLLINKADANAKNRDGFTPLHWLAFIAHPPEQDVKEMVNCLVDANADLCERTPNSAFEVNFHFKSPLEMAVLPGSRFPKRLMYLLTPSFQEVPPDPANPLVGSKRRTVSTVFEDLCLLSSHNEVASEELARQILKVNRNNMDPKRVNQVRVDAQKENSVDCLASLIHMAPRAAEGMFELLMVRPEVANAGHHPISSRAILSGSGIWRFYTTPMRCQYQRDAITKVVNGEEITWPVWDFDSTRPLAEQVGLNWQRKLMRVPADLNARQDYVKDVDTRVLLLPNVLNINIYKALSMTWHTQIFARLPIQAIVWCLWDNVVVDVYLWTFFFNLLELAMLVIWCMTSTDGKVGFGAPTHSPREVCMFWVVVLAHIFRQGFNQLWYIVSALLKWRAYRFSWLQYQHNSFATLYYLWSPRNVCHRQNIVEVLHFTMRCALVFCVMSNPEGEMTNHEQELLAFTTLFTAVLCVYNCNVIRGCEPIIAMQRTLLSPGPTQLMFALIFGVFIGLAFTFATLRRKHDLWWIAIFLYRGLLFGDGDGFDHIGVDPNVQMEDHVEQELLMMIGTVFVYVALLNLLIAIFESEYRKHEKEAELLGLQKRAEYCCRYLVTMKKVPEMYVPGVGYLVLAFAPVSLMCALAVMHRQGLAELWSGVLAAGLIALAEVKWQARALHNDWFHSQQCKMARVISAAVGHGDVADISIDNHYIDSTPKRGITAVTVSHASMMVISKKTYDVFGNCTAACEELVSDFEHIPLGRIVMLCMRSSVTAAPIHAPGGELSGEMEEFFDYSGLLDDVVFNGPLSLAFTLRWDGFVFTEDNQEAESQISVCLLDMCVPMVPHYWPAQHLCQLRILATGSVDDVHLHIFTSQDSAYTLSYTVTDALHVGDSARYLLTVSRSGTCQLVREGALMALTFHRLRADHNPLLSRPQCYVGRPLLGKRGSLDTSAFKGRLSNVHLWRSAVDWHDAFPEPLHLTMDAKEALRSVGAHADFRDCQGYALIGRKGATSVDSIAEMWGHQAVAEKAILRTGALVPGRQVILQNPAYLTTLALEKDGSCRLISKRGSSTQFGNLSYLGNSSSLDVQESFRVVDAAQGFIALFSISLRRFLCVDSGGYLYGSQRYSQCPSKGSVPADARFSEVDAGGGMIALHSPQGPGWYLRMESDSKFHTVSSFSSGPYLQGSVEIKTVEGLASKLPECPDGDCEFDVHFIDTGTPRFSAPHFLWVCHRSDFDEDQWQVSSEDAQMKKMAKVDDRVSKIDKRLKEYTSKLDSLAEKLAPTTTLKTPIDLGGTAPSLAGSLADLMEVPSPRSPSTRLLRRAHSRRDTASSINTQWLENEG